MNEMKKFELIDAESRVIAAVSLSGVKKDTLICYREKHYGYDTWRCRHEDGKAVEEPTWIFREREVITFLAIV